MEDWEEVKARLSVGFVGHVPGGSCEAEKPCLGCDIRAALREENARLRAECDALERDRVHGQERLREFERGRVASDIERLTRERDEARANAEAERSAKWARLDKAEAEVARLERLILDIQKSPWCHVYGQAKVWDAGGRGLTGADVTAFRIQVDPELARRIHAQREGGR